MFGCFKPIHPPNEWVEIYEKWCKLPLQRRLNTPLERPLYEHKSNEQWRAPRGFTKPNTEEECKLIDPGIILKRVISFI